MRGFYWLLGFFGLMFILDLISTLSIGDLIRHLEANPAYDYIGIAGIVFLNFLIPFLLWLWYKNTDNVASRFTMMLPLVTVSLLRIFIVYNNFTNVSNPPTLEEAQAIPKAVKTGYFIMLWLGYLILMLPAFITFHIWKLDHHVKKVKV